MTPGADVVYWPEPEASACPKCGAVDTGYVVGGWRFCIGARCDRNGKQLAALNTWFMQAAKLASEARP